MDPNSSYLRWTKPPRPALGSGRRTRSHRTAALHIGVGAGSDPLPSWNDGATKHRSPHSSRA